jgi:DNA-3-methyladenine glycosylase I
VPIERCPWAGSDPLMVAYHDREWGVPVHDDRLLFEFLILEGAQAGLSWSTVLHKRERYREVFAGFDPGRVARFRAAKVERLLADPGIIRNRRKVEGAIRNARAFLAIQERHGTFDAWVWTFVGGAPIVNRRRRPRDVPATTAESETLARAFAQHDFTFVGPTIVYAFMQAVGMVNDHLVDCPRFEQLGARGGGATAGGSRRGNPSRARP